MVLWSKPWIISSPILREIPGDLNLRKGNKMHSLKSLFLLFAILICINTSAQSIHRTACQGNIDRLDSLLQESSIQVKDEQGRSLLFWAVACRQQEVFDLLIDRGIDIQAVDNNQEIALQIAIRYDRERFFDRLIELYPDTDWTQSYGASLMEMAVLNKSPSFIQKLIDQGVDIDAVNDRGSTPLEIAKRMGASEIVEKLLSLGADESKVRSFELKGEYMGQKAPGLTPAVFAPHVISTEESEFGSVFNADNTEFYYGVDIKGKPEIRYSKRSGEHWSKPQVLLSHAQYSYNDPFLSPDEKRLYFISKRAMEGMGEPKDVDIWFVERQEDGWSEPINAGSQINSERNEYYMSFTREGTMYFSSNTHAPKERENYDYDIYYSKFAEGEFQAAIPLGDSINTPDYEADVFVDPAENYLIFCATRSDGLGRGDLYISFKNSEGKWTKSVNMGAPVNTTNHELCPFVSADGKYLFYTSDQDIYWVDAGIIEEIRVRENK